MDLWMARWPNNANPGAIDTNGDPPGTAGYPNIYGVWNPTYPNTPDPAPWDFWQYASTGSVSGISGNVDLDVAHGNFEFVKDFLIPAMWTIDGSGSWQNTANWNSSPDLPGPNDRVIIDRPAGTYTITLSSGTHGIRSLLCNEILQVSAGSLTIQQYAKVNNSLSISGGLVRLSNGGSTSVVKELAITGSGKLDLGDNDLVIDYTGGSPIQAVRTMLASGSLMSGASDASKRPLYADNAQRGLAVFSGQSVDSTSILIKFTYTGDANFDDTVDILDLGLIAAAWQSSNIGSGVVFDYNGVIDINELGLLAFNWQAGVQGGSATPTALPWAVGDALSSLGLPSVAVPEPTSLGTVVVAVWIGSARRRRRATDQPPNLGSF